MLYGYFLGFFKFLLHLLNVEYLKGVQESFPHSMIEDALKLNIAWEFGVTWKNAPSRIDRLEASIFFLTEIENPYCKHGTYSFIKQYNSFIVR